MNFYLGTHKINHANHFDRAFISVRILRNRKSDFLINDWILDSGAFSELALYGKYETSIEQYANEINRWRVCGNMELAVSQDYMCEPFMLEKTGLDISTHQKLTIARYDELVKLTDVMIMPVLQGYKTDDYKRHLTMYEDRFEIGKRVGVGSICKRNTDIYQIANILEVIKNERPDLKLHGFGLKLTALKSAYITDMLYSADSMAWSYAARRNGLNANGLMEAMDFYNQINLIKGIKGHQLSLCN